MFERCLYGVRVYSEFELFDTPAATAAEAPGEHAPVSLVAMPAGQVPPATTEEFSLYYAHNRELYLHTDRECGFSQPGQPWRLEVRDVVSFYWLGGETEIRYVLHDQGTQPFLVFWFVHIFLPMYLTLERGHDFIHAAGVEVGDKAILLLAPSTGGKSTLGEYFLNQGHAMVSDDKVATFLHQDAFYAIPSHPHHRPWREYEVLGAPVENFANGPRLIRAFYLLEQGEPDSDVEITEVTGFRKFEELMPNYLYSFTFLQEQRLRWLAQLADGAPVYRVTRPWNLERMHEVYEALCEHAAAIDR